jgi:pimeloyl-ACP methyl ester carboxylesterase
MTPRNRDSFAPRHSTFDDAVRNLGDYARKFSSKRTHRIINGIGHNLPQEAPQALAEAIVDVEGY